MRRPARRGTALRAATAPGRDASCGKSFLDANGRSLANAPAICNTSRGLFFGETAIRGGAVAPGRRRGLADDLAQGVQEAVDFLRRVVVDEADAERLRHAK